ncbi:MAG: right-handed parallel beta-helix repeat-containing protein [Sphingobacteriales bacterium]|jgi:hypothetical protein|nr:right-handed parallel beta-helix repeat-containing protein [Sphingobacteriales bacterium]MBP9142409.1 right-handed parallel beta-helix repeat-containing protein [Chitinophagales bacterium]MDA0197517.1 right-handed parallel beta-helix repeat-containing protein [Bacteroidota bacterium]MBK6890597.1 right-handed parallel beta-helix repeat-containing protein [Sphingobacteriales bacterium]MBK7526352.1 right-handed parallel beta-helix repeat-containing protein [Sphingobacteriales bacterium]
MKAFVFILSALCFCLTLPATTLKIGTGQTYTDLQTAANAAKPGDTLLIYGGTYPGGLFIENLKGTASKWITIKNAPDQTVIFEGGSNAIHFVEPEYLHFSGLIFQYQTGNGVNLDDGGTYDTPAHDIIFENCTFRDMSASGNNDLLKLSGLDYFEVRNCLFENGAEGGSGIDMVGCHHGKIVGNRFENMGSNAIQCKGGSEYVHIAGNFFKNAGQRTLNIGGSTGLQFFRPDTAHYEAARIQVYCNIMIGSIAPIAYVGAVEVDVANNTIYFPDKWAIRILQETVDPNQFLPCGDNFFRNNIVVLSNKNSVITNIGPDTAPETFAFSNNLWFNVDNTSWNGPDIPVAETNQIINQNPLLENPDAEDFSIPPSSAGAGKGMLLTEPKFDYLQQKFANPPSIGAIEANPATAVYGVASNNTINDNIIISFNPEDRLLRFVFPEKMQSALPLQAIITNLNGQVVFSQKIDGNKSVKINQLPQGVYVVRAGNYVGKIALYF